MYGNNVAAQCQNLQWDHIFNTAVLHFNEFINVKSNIMVFIGPAVKSLPLYIKIRRKCEVYQNFLEILRKGKNGFVLFRVPIGNQMTGPFFVLNIFMARTSFQYKNTAIKSNPLKTFVFCENIHQRCPWEQLRSVARCMSAKWK